MPSDNASDYYVLGDLVGLSCKELNSK